MTAPFTAPVIETERLVMRVPDGRDVPATIAFFASERSRFYFGPLEADEAWRRLASYAGQWLLRGYGFFAVTLRDTGETIGFAGPMQSQAMPEPEMSWLITDAAHESRGYAREACAAVLAHLFREHDWASVVSYIDPANHASQGLATRLGAVRDPHAFVPAALPGCEAWRHHREGAR